MAAAGRNFARRGNDNYGIDTIVTRNEGGLGQMRQRQRLVPTRVGGLEGRAAPYCALTKR